MNPPNNNHKKTWAQPQQERDSQLILEVINAQKKENNASDQRRGQQPAETHTHKPAAQSKDIDPQYGWKHKQQRPTWWSPGPGRLGVREHQEQQPIQATDKHSYPLHRVTLKRHQGCLTGELRFENVAANVCRSQPGAKRCAGRCRFKCAAAERCVQSALLQVNTVTWPCRGAVHLQHQIKLHHETLQPQVSHCLANTRKN